eukprot:SAG25_NODE_200_length_12050_cov_3.693247_4_plen_123_part_00
MEAAGPTAHKDPTTKSENDDNEEEGNEGIPMSARQVVCLAFAADGNGNTRWLCLCSRANRIEEPCSWREPCGLGTSKDTLRLHMIYRRIFPTCRDAQTYWLFFLIRTVAAPFRAEPSRKQTN